MFNHRPSALSLIAQALAAFAFAFGAVALISIATLI